MPEKKLNFSPEERSMIAQLVRSPGWYVVMRDIIIPQINAASARIDAMGAPEGQTNGYRGLKQGLLQLVDALYRYGELPNPLEIYREAMLETLQHFSGVEAEEVVEVSHWVVAGSGVCGTGGDGPIMGAAAKDGVTCEGCRNILDENHDKRQHQHATGIV